MTRPGPTGKQGINERVSWDRIENVVRDFCKLGMGRA